MMRFLLRTAPTAARVLSALSLSALLFVALPGCQVVPSRKGDVTAVDMTAASRAVTALEQAAREADEAYRAVVSAPTPELKQAFSRFAGAVDRFDRATAGVKRAIAEVERTAGEFLTAYSTEREQIKNTELRAAMLMRKESVERQIADLKVELSATLAATETLRSELGDLRSYFAASLNPQAVQGAAVLGEMIAHAIDTLGQSTSRVTLELTDLVTSLASEPID